MDQEIRFCTTTDGTRIAYALSGDGPPVVRVFDWYTHLELELNDRGWSEFYSTLSSQHRLIRYDLPGVGLSDRDVRDFSHRAKVGYLAAVVDALELEQVDLFSMAVGGPTAIICRPTPAYSPLQLCRMRDAAGAERLRGIGVPFLDCAPTVAPSLPDRSRSPPAS